MVNSDSRFSRGLTAAHGRATEGETTIARPLPKQLGATNRWPDDAFPDPALDDSAAMLVPGWIARIFNP